ncbi:LysR family transcriptional regulator [Escherichia coli]|nr:LysR family transcriptional regulator [Escherichia coli]
MKREEIADLMAFVVVAEERSFTRAAARLSMAQSALSQIVRRIEERLGLRLLTRTTRSVVPTEAGEHLLSVLGPRLAYLPYDQVERAIKEKKLIRVLDKFTPDLPGYHLYYPHRRHAGSAFSLFIDRLKYKGAV